MRLQIQRRDAKSLKPQRSRRNTKGKIAKIAKIARIAEIQRTHRRGRRCHMTPRAPCANLRKGPEGRLLFWIRGGPPERYFSAPKEAVFGLGPLCPPESALADKGA